MDNAETVHELTDICERLLEIVLAQSYLLGQLGAEVMEEERLREADRLEKLKMRLPPGVGTRIK